MIDQTKDNFTQPPSFKEILDELEISKGDYCRNFSIWKDEDLKYIWKGNLIPVLLIIILMLVWNLASQNVDKKPDFNEYKAVR